MRLNACTSNAGAARVGGWLLSFALALGPIGLVLPSPEVALADDVSEASTLLAAGNAHLQRATRLRGARRTEALEAALAQYVASLERVRSRNTLYNTAITLEMLERAPEAFNTWTEYLGVEGLSDAERSDGAQHRDALRPRVAVVRVTANVAAEVWVDRRDLGTRGRTPLELALPAGAHTFFVRAEAHLDAQRVDTLMLGQTVEVALVLEAAPVAVQVFVPDGAALRVDGEVAQAGQALALRPGTHLAEVVVGAEVVSERRFEVLPGASPVTIDLAGVTIERRGQASVDANVVAVVELDGARVGAGSHVEFETREGVHRLVVSAPGRSPVDVTHSLTRFPARYQVTLAPQPQTWVHVGRGVAGGLALGGTIAGIYFLVAAANARDANEASGSQSSADALRQATAGVDIAWSVAALTGAAAIVFLLLDPGGGESTATLAVAPTVGGASLTLSGVFGGAL